MFNHLFLNHPHSVGENYAEHFVAASGFGFTLLWAGLACLMHAIVPALFVTTGSKAITRLHERMVLKRRRAPIAESPAPESAVKG